MADETRINVIHPSFGAASIPESSLEEAQRKGWSVESGAQEADRYYQQEYGDSGLAAVGEGALRTLTFGGSDVAAEAIGAGEGVRERRKRNPGAATVGEIGGALLPIGAPAAAGRAGAAAARAVESKLGAGLVAKGVGAATEGALFGGGQGVSKVSLADDPMTVEAALLTIGGEALYGGGLGFGVGVGGALLGQAAAAGRDQLRKFASAEAAPTAAKQIGDDLLEVLERKPGKPTGEVREALKAQSDELGTAIEAERASITKARETLPQDAAKWRADLTKAREGTQAELRQLDSLVRQTRARGDKMLAQAGDVGVAAERTQLDEILKAQKAATAEAQRFLPDLARSGRKAELAIADDALEAAIKNPEARAALNQLRERNLEVLRSLDPSTTYVDQIARHSDDFAVAASQRADMEARLAQIGKPVSSEKLTKLEADYAGLEKLLGGSTAAQQRKMLADAVAKAEAAGMRATADDLMAAIPGVDAAALKSLSPDVLNAAKAQVFRHSLKAQRATQAAKSRGYGLLGGVALGLGADWLFDGPIGLIVGAGIGGRFGGRLARAGVAATGVKARVLAQAKKLSDRVANGVDAFIKAGPQLRRGATAAAVTLSRDDVKQRAEALRTAVADDAKTMSARRQVNTALAPLRAVDLQLGDHVEGVAMRRLQFLAAKAPAQPPIGSSYRLQKRWEPSEFAARKFSRYVAATEDPTVILDEMRTGRLTIETVEAVQEVYPELYARIQGHLSERLGELREDLPRNKRITLSILFGVPVDSSMRPEFIAAMQANYMTPEAQPRAISKNDIGSVKVHEEPTTGQSLSG